MADNNLTNSKIRSIYGEIKRIQMGEFEKEKTSFYLLKPKVAYALGRDDKNQGLKLFKLIFDKYYRSYKYMQDQLGTDFTHNYIKQNLSDADSGKEPLR